MHVECIFNRGTECYKMSKDAPETGGLGKREDLEVKGRLPPNMDSAHGPAR